jgi:hypothetical protein
VIVRFVLSSAEVSHLVPLLGIALSYDDNDEILQHIVPLLGMALSYDDNDEILQPIADLNHVVGIA